MTRPLNRPMITLSIMLATVMQTLDSTIANVALPHMQGSLSASQDQIAWVLTRLHRGRGDRPPRSPVGSSTASGRKTYSWRRSAASPSPPCFAEYRTPWRKSWPRACCKDIRRSSGAAVPGRPIGHQPEGTPGSPPWRSGGSASWSDRHWDRHWRLAHRQLQLAMGVLHQPTHRIAGRVRRVAIHSPGAGHKAHEFRHVRIRHAQSGDRRTAAAARPRPTEPTGSRRRRPDRSHRIGRR